jgi:hypothetical protein
MFKSLIAATAAVGFAALMPAATGRSRSWDPRSAPVSQGSGLFSAARLRPAKSMSFRHRRHHRRAWVIVEPDAK